MIHRLWDEDNSHLSLGIYKERKEFAYGTLRTKNVCSLKVRTQIKTYVGSVCKCTWVRLTRYLLPMPNSLGRENSIVYDCMAMVEYHNIYSVGDVEWLRRNSTRNRKTPMV